VTAAVSGSMLGGAYTMPLSQGLLVSFFLFLLFRGNGLPPLVIPVVIAAAWIGNTINLFLPMKPQLFALPGAVYRVSAIVLEAYFMHLAVLLLISFREWDRQAAPLSEGATEVKDPL